MSSDDGAIMDLCARVFADNALLSQTLTHAVGEPRHVGPHAHDDVLQLDLIDGCEGRCWYDRQWHGVSGRVLLASYPGQEHGYELRYGDEPSRVYVVKLKVAGNWPAVRRRVFPRLFADVTVGASGASASGGGGQMVLAPLRNLMKSDILRVDRSARVVAYLAEVLCLWPRRASSHRQLPADYNETAVENLDDELSQAIRLIHQRPGDPPSLEELAEVTSVSPRHFVRLFQQTIGCSPHAYITSRRFKLARELLLAHRLKVHQIAGKLGFSSAATFSRWFTQHAGMSPLQFRRDPAVG